MRIAPSGGRFDIWLSLAALLLMADVRGSRIGDVCAEENPATTGEKGAIFGKLVDSAGAPVVGGEIRLFRQARPYRMIPPNSKVLSGADGTFRFYGLPNAHFRLAAEKQGFARAFRGVTIEDHEQQEASVILNPPAIAVIAVKDEAGRPIVGARVREFRLRGPNGPPYFPNAWLEPFGITIAPSDATGQLRLPPLPVGEIVTVTIDHEKFAPTRVSDMTISPGIEVEAAMRPGARLTFQFIGDLPRDQVCHFSVVLNHEIRENPSTRWLCAIPVDISGAGTLTVEPGAYEFLRFDHDDYFITPEFRREGGKEFTLRIEQGHNENLWFQVRRKVTARGRVINAETGLPLGETHNSIAGEILNEPVAGTSPAPPGKWSQSKRVNTDKNGEYTIPLAAGLARVSFEGNSNFVPEQAYVEFTVAADGSTIIPDLRVRPLRIIVGVVLNPDGTPASKAVVRFRGQYLRWTQPVLTDEAGRFELQPPWMPVDADTLQPLPIHPLVAFDPHRPLTARVDVRLDKPDEVHLKLEPHEPNWLLSAFSEEFTDWERGVAPAAGTKNDPPVSLRGRSPPELQGVAWLNSTKPVMTLGDFRGKFVLLDFWFTACGPCHDDFPTVKLISEFYKDDVVVIGVHNNSASLEGVRAHAKKIGLQFPIVVDHSDGRVVTPYQANGMVDGFPSYVLIDPNGKVLLDDQTIPSPLLRLYKLEIIRQLVLQSQKAAK